MKNLDLYGDEIVEPEVYVEEKSCNAINPFEFVNSINEHKDIMTPEIKAQYIPWLVNKQFSYFPDTIGAANLVNRVHQLDKDLQYHLLLNIISPRKRFSKWTTKEKGENVDLVKEAYGYSQKKAEVAVSLLSPTQIDMLKSRTKKGGLKNENYNR